MSATGLEVFDRTIQSTNGWLNEIGDEIGSGKHVAWHVLGVVLRALRDTQTIEMAARISAGLPLIVRGAYYDQYRPSISGVRITSRDAMVQQVTEGLAHIRPVPAEVAITSVLRVVGQYLPAGQVAKARAALPPDLQTLWPESTAPMTVLPAMIPPEVPVALN